MPRLRSKRPQPERTGGAAAPGEAQRLLLILDLDETLLHATETPLERAPDHRVFQYSLYLRPGLGEFLEQMASLFRIAVWTSSSLDYAEQVCALLFRDPAVLDFVWARDRCTFRMDWEQQTGCHAKHLSKLRRYGYDLRRVLVVDDSPEKHARNYGNLVCVAPFTGSLADAELVHLARYLRQLAAQPNMRCIEKRGWRLNVQSATTDAGEPASSSGE